MRCLPLLAGLIAAAPACAAEFKMFWPRWQGSGFYSLPHAAPPESDPRSGECLAVMSGVIEEGDYKKLLQMIYGEPALAQREDWDGKSPPGFHVSYTSDGSELGQALCLDSRGGSLPEALKMAHLLLDHDVGLATKIMPGNRCESACAVLFMAGSLFLETEFITTNLQREIRPGGKLGVHAPSLTLPEGGSYTGAQVSKSFNIALAAARETFDFAFETDSEGQRIIAPYVFARFLETPPEDMYYLDTVGDALLGGFTVTGYDAKVDVNAQLVRTICDNAFMLDDGLFPFSQAPTWKSRELLSAKDIAAEFREKLPDKGRGWILEEAGTVSYKDETEFHDGDFFGRAAGYPEGYPINSLDCLVRIETLGGPGRQSLGKVETPHDTSGFLKEIKVKVVSGYSAPNEPKIRPHEAWAQSSAAEKEGSGNSGQHQYPFLIAFPFGMELADLPRISSQEAQAQDAAAHSCDALWHRRNQIFHDNGYCFGGPRGIAAFGNDGCYTKSPGLTPSEAEEIARIKQMEKDMGC